MSFTYTSNPATVPLDAVRFLVGDTDSTRAELQDSEVTFAISLSSVPALAAAQLADALAAKYSAQVDKQIGDLKITLSQKAAQFKQLAQSLRANAWRSPALLIASAPYAGGLKIQEKLDQLADTDATHPSFRRGMNDYVTDTSSSQSIVSPIP